ncbi:MAG: AAA family ATPase [Planctomycetes bacterium]|nr:AAA family ATPase [Planctomycetota bacterium]
MENVGLSSEEIERLILKYLLARGSTEGRRVAQNLCLPFGLLAPIFNDLKTLQLVAYRNSTSIGDYEYILTDVGRERARRYSEECTYFGAAPVSLKDYVDSVKAQTITNFNATAADLRKAFGDLIINEGMLRRLGPAINSGRGMFLFGPPGNGKTSIAERITNCFGSTIYIPKAIGVDGEIIRVFDPAVHERVADKPNTGGFMNDFKVDSRWVKVRRPTVIAGGELTMAELEIRLNQATKICEAPIQLKSNCGTLVIDDFGRQRMPVVELLNRWIVPLEKRYDFLSVPCGKRIQVPFDQMIIFSTNLEPRELVDAAFLRRIPYKIAVPDPTLEEFHKLFALVGNQLGFTYDKRAVDYLIARHYAPTRRPLRACQPRDILLQVKYFCQYLGHPPQLTPDALDFACETYFSVM